MKHILVSVKTRGLAEVRRRKTFATYAIIGFSGMLLDVLTFVALTRFVHMPAVPATIASTSVGIINNFFLNTYFNFKRFDRLWARFISFYSVGALGIGASALTLFVFADLVGFDATIVKIASIPPIVLGQYFLNKHVSFSEVLGVAESDRTSSFTKDVELGEEHA